MGSLSRLHHSWVGYSERVPDDEPRVVVHRRRVSHCLIWMKAGRARGRSVCRGREQAVHLAAGEAHFFVADGEEHTLIGRRNPAHEFSVLLMPRDTFEGVASAEGVSVPGELTSWTSLDDAELRWCLARLPADTPAGGGADVQRDEASRRLVLRLLELSGAGRPEWRADASVFDRVTLGNLVDHIDEHLRVAPALEDIALLVGLSPSHFARKFRHSTGLSLHRFVNLRRVLAAIRMLRSDATPVAHIALEVGFSSQSHFTRVFSELTGMTPVRYRKQFRRAVM